MDIEYGRRISDEIMTNPAYNPSNAGGSDDLWSDDPREFMERLSAGGTSFPMPCSYPTPKEVRSKLQARSKSIFVHWNLLKNIVERYESVIQKRWLKKTKEKRKEMLLQVFPDISISHRPDFQAFKSKSSSLQGASKRTPYLWPQINLEDLLKPKFLLIFLNSRGRNTPDAFTKADLDACHLGMVTNAITRPFLNCHVVMFTGRRTPDVYGELISWDEHADAIFLLTSQRGMQPGDALNTLEIQQWLYCFLADCCKAILHEIPEVNLGDPSFPMQPEPPSLLSPNTGLVSLAAIAAETPYKLPANLNLERVHSIIAAKFSAAEDHVWALREDPEYFAEIVLDYSEHRQERLRDTRGRKHPVLDDPRKEPIFWERVISDVVVTATTNMQHWGTLCTRVKELLDLQTQYKARISPEKDLPDDYALAFYKLFHHLMQLSKGPIGLLKVGFVSSPPMRRFFVRLPQDPASTKIKTAIRSDVHKDNASEELIWIFTTLFDEDRLHLIGLNTLMDELGYLVEKDPQAKDLISAWVADQISDLAVYSQSMHQIKLYQPWAATFEDAMVRHEDEIQADFAESSKFLAAAIRCTFGGAIPFLGNPTDGKFTYPVHKRRTKGNVDKMREAEHNLDTFWRTVDQELVSKNAISPLLAELLKERFVHRTAEYQEPLKDAKSSDYTVDDLLMPLSEFYFEQEPPSKKPMSYEAPIPPKIKTKTRGVADPLLKDGPEEDNVLCRPPGEDIQPTFRVDKRAVKTFKTLFFVPSHSAQPGEVAWGDFLHALVSTGFSAEKLYGSVWQFTPTMLDVQRGIQFHEPHPSGKLSFNKARRFGRRLNRAYGWHGGMFVAA